MMRLAAWLLALCLPAVLALAPPARADGPALSMPAPAGSSFSPAQRAEIIGILRAALKADPSILRDAIGALQEDDGQRQQASMRTAIARNAAALLRTQGDPVAGNPNGDVTVVQFYDLRCPYCRKMLPELSDLLKQDPRIRMVYKDYPILGPASVVGAKAVLAAQRQGGYFRLHDLLMTGTANIDMGVVQAAAQQAGLDWARLRHDMDDPAIQARIDANLALARTLQIDGTPTFVIGGDVLPGAITLAELQGAVAGARQQ